MEWAISLHEACFYLYLHISLQKLLLMIISIGCGYCDMGELDLGGIVNKF
jgi:hypothetical protein